MDKEQKASEAIELVIPLLEKYNFRWVITGGFACYVYGVKREISDIDIDIDTSKDAPEFQKFIAELVPHITQPLIHFVDQNYDNYNFEITVGGQVVDICPMAEMKVFNKDTKLAEHFYASGFPAFEMIKFHNFSLPLLSKELIVKNKEMLVWQRESDTRDIVELRKLI